MEQFFIEILMVMPGGFIRWLWLGRKQKFFVFLDEDDSIYNYLLSILLIVVIILLVVFLKK